MAREINLVPDIKNEMIKALRLRNFIIFLSIIIAGASVGIIVVLGVIVGGQQIALSGKDTQLNLMSDKVNSYNDLGDFLTVQSQLNQLSNIADDKKVASRLFGVFSTLLPTDGNVVVFDRLTLDLSGDEEENAVFQLSASITANKPPYNGFNALEAFKKSMQYMKYDYGRYVDREGNYIPTYCIIEYGADGSALQDAERGVYALWMIDARGCNPAIADSNSGEQAVSEEDDGEDEGGDETRNTDYVYENYDGQNVVRIWRTPQYDEWYKQGTMDIDGTISGIAHFESSCITYRGVQQGESKLEWISTNNQCLLVPGGADGMLISKRDGEDDGRGVSFSAAIKIDMNVFRFTNKHVLTIGPSGRYNVTDSYAQIEDMFTKKGEK